MLSPVEPPPQAPRHPAFCEHDIPAGPGILHVSADRPVADHHVTVERCDGQPAAIRLEGDHEPMTPGQALALGCTLQIAAITAFADGRR